MKIYGPEAIRNVAFVGHGASGKTTLVDALAFVSGASRRHGSIKEGSTLTDTSPDEIERKHSISLSIGYAEWMNTKVNLLDAPGYLDFFGEVICGLSVADGAVVVLSAVSGVEVGTERCWETLDRLHLPRILFVSGMDKEHANFERVFNDVKQRLTPKVLPVEIPVGDGAQFRGIINLFTQTCQLFKPGSKAGEFEETPVPPEYQDAFSRYKDQMIEAVAATGTPVVVVVIGGSAVTMSRWLDRVGAVVMAWYPGEQGGHAVADVLFGAVNPAGRLPITFPLEEGQLPLVYNHKPTGRGDDYVDLSGHPLFPFGHGLSYTTFEYDSLRFDRDTIGPGDSVRVSFTVRNSGRRAGHEVAQLYVRDLLASVARPVQELKGFERVSLQPGESRRVSMMLTPRHLRMLDGSGRWVVEPGAFRVTVGASSRDLRLRGTLTVR